MRYEIFKLLEQIKDKMGIIVYDELRKEIEQYEFVIGSLHLTIADYLLNHHNLEDEEKENER